MKKVLLLFNGVIILASCNSGTTLSTDSSEELNKPITTVMVGYPSDTVMLNNNIALNGTAAYLLRSDVKANANGYIIKMSIKLADHVNRGAVIFGIETKEARALGNTINKLDESFRFNGNTTVLSPATGYVAMLNHQIGDYVQDGETLATITDGSSFGVSALPSTYFIRFF